jgi:hypothetical protein
MFGLSRKKKRIDVILMRCETERALFLYDLRLLAPVFKAGAGAGVALFVLRKASPMLRPLAFGLIQRALAKRNSPFLFKLVGLVSTVVGFIVRKAKK